MTDYLVIYERAEDGSWSARTPDLPVYAVGSSHAEAETEIRSALALHLEAQGPGSGSSGLPSRSGHRQRLTHALTAHRQPRWSSSTRTSPDIERCVASGCE